EALENVFQHAGASALGEMLRAGKDLWDSSNPIARAALKKAMARAMDNTPAAREIKAQIRQEAGRRQNSKLSGCLADLAGESPEVGRALGDTLGSNKRALNNFLRNVDDTRGTQALGDAIRNLGQSDAAAETMKQPEFWKNPDLAKHVNDYLKQQDPQTQLEMLSALPAKTFGSDMLTKLGQMDDAQMARFVEGLDAKSLEGLKNVLNNAGEAEAANFVRQMARVAGGEEGLAKHLGKIKALEDNGILRFVSDAEAAGLKAAASKANAAAAQGGQAQGGQETAKTQEKSESPETAKTPSTAPGTAGDWVNRHIAEPVRKTGEIMQAAGRGLAARAGKWAENHRPRSVGDVIRGTEVGLKILSGYIFIELAIKKLQSRGGIEGQAGRLQDNIKQQDNALAKLAQRNMGGLVDGFRTRYMADDLLTQMGRKNQAISESAKFIEKSDQQLSKKLGQDVADMQRRVSDGEYEADPALANAVGGKAVEAARAMENAYSRIQDAGAANPLERVRAVNDLVRAHAEFEGDSARFRAAAQEYSRTHPGEVNKIIDDQGRQAGRLDQILTAYSEVTRTRKQLDEMRQKGAPQNDAEVLKLQDQIRTAQETLSVLGVEADDARLQSRAAQAQIEGMQRRLDATLSRMLNTADVCNRHVEAGQKMIDQGLYRANPDAMETLLLRAPPESAVKILDSGGAEVLRALTPEGQSLLGSRLSEGQVLRQAEGLQRTADIEAVRQRFARTESALSEARDAREALVKMAGSENTRRNRASLQQANETVKQAEDNHKASKLALAESEGNLRAAARLMEGRPLAELERLAQQPEFQELVKRSPAMQEALEIAKQADQQARVKPLAAEFLEYLHQPANKGKDIRRAFAEFALQKRKAHETPLRLQDMGLRPRDLNVEAVQRFVDNNEVALQRDWIQARQNARQLEGMARALSSWVDPVTRRTFNLAVQAEAARAANLEAQYARSLGISQNAEYARRSAAVLEYVEKNRGGKQSPTYQRINDYFKIRGEFQRLKALSEGNRWQRLQFEGAEFEGKRGVEALERMVEHQAETIRAIQNQPELLRAVFEAEGLGRLRLMELDTPLQNKAALNLETARSAVKILADSMETLRGEAKTAAAAELVRAQETLTAAEAEYAKAFGDKNTRPLNVLLGDLMVKLVDAYKKAGEEFKDGAKLTDDEITARMNRVIEESDYNNDTRTQMTDQQRLVLNAMARRFATAHSDFQSDYQQLGLVARAAEIHLLNLNVHGAKVSFAQQLSGEVLLLSMGLGKTTALESLFVAQEVYRNTHNNAEAPPMFFVTANDSLVAKDISEAPAMQEWLRSGRLQVVNEESVGRIIDEGFQPGKVYAMSNEGLKKIDLELRNRGYSDSQIAAFFKPVGTVAWDEVHSAFHAMDTIIGSSGSWEFFTHPTKTLLTRTVVTLTETSLRLNALVGKDLGLEGNRWNILDNESGRPGRYSRNQVNFNLDYVIKFGEFKGQTLGEALRSIGLDPAANRLLLQKFAQVQYNQNGCEYVGKVDPFTGRPVYGTAQNGLGRANTIYGDQMLSALTLIDITIKHYGLTADTDVARFAQGNPEFVKAAAEALAHMTAERVTMLEAMEFLGMHKVLGYSGTLEGMARTLQQYGKTIQVFSPEGKAGMEQVRAGEVFMSAKVGDTLLVLEKNPSTGELHVARYQGADAQNYLFNRIVDQNDGIFQKVVTGDNTEVLRITAEDAHKNVAGSQFILISDDTVRQHFEQMKAKGRAQGVEWGTQKAMDLAITDMVRRNPQGRVQVILVDGMSPETYARALDPLKNAMHEMPKTIAEVLAIRGLDSEVRASLNNYRAAFGAGALFADWTKLHLDAKGNPDDMMIRLDRSISGRLGWNQKRIIFAPSIGEGWNGFGIQKGYPASLQAGGKVSLINLAVLPEDVMNQSLYRANVEGKRWAGITGMYWDIDTVKNLTSADAQLFKDFFASADAVKSPEQFYNLFKTVMNNYLVEIDTAKTREMARTTAGALEPTQAVQVAKASPEYLRAMARKAEQQLPAILRQYVNLEAVTGRRP
ncbi:hypothetical protein JW933_11440, partial [candidate division FCPU426 bacterium]|nr:hypothetical protein [candidate division FCPU426 bacterium]